MGKAEVLAALREAAPIHAVRGNVDRAPPLSKLPETLLVELGGVGIYLLHDLNDLDLSPGAAGIRVVISGHSHQPKVEERGGVTYLNPGSVGPRRFSLPVAYAWLHLDRAGELKVEPMTLKV